MKRDEESQFAAVKVIEIALTLQIINKKETSGDEYNALKNEALILQQLNHPNIVKFKDVSICC